MKSIDRRLIACLFICLTSLYSACAAGDLAGGDFDDHPSDGSSTDTHHSPDVNSDIGFSPSDAGSPDDTFGQDISASDTIGQDSAPPDAPQPDASATDTANSDTSQTDAENPCAGERCGAEQVCDSAQGICVDCLDDGDCAQGVCDAAQNKCIGCRDSADCASQEECHDRAAICVPSCCDQVEAQTVLLDAGYTHNRFDIAAAADGTPAVVFVDEHDDGLKFAQPLGGQWMTQTVATLVSTTSVQVRLALDSSGAPHMILGRGQELKHYWRDDQGWHESDLLVDVQGVSYCDIKIDSQDGVHFVALVQHGARVYYAYHLPSGLTGGQDLALPAPNPPVWTNLALTSDDRPIISFQIGLDKTAFIAEKLPTSGWHYEEIAQNVYQTHGLAVDIDDEPVVVYRRAESADGLRILRRNADTWSDSLLVADPAHGNSPDVVVDSLGDPHILYTSHGPGDFEDPLQYARWNGVDWEHHTLTQVDRAFYPRIAIDAQDGLHGLVYDPSSAKITYLKIR